MDQASQKVLDRAKQSGAPVAGLGAAPTTRRRDPSRPGHFLDEAPLPPGAGDSLIDHIMRNPDTVIPAEIRQSVRLGPYANAARKLGPTNPIPPARQEPAAGRPLPGRPDAFLTLAAFQALDAYIDTAVAAAIAERTGSGEAARQKRNGARAEFVANYVKG